MDLCCAEWTEPAAPEKVKMKQCEAEEGNYQIIWTRDSETGKFFKYTEMYKQDEQRCQKLFDSEGKVTGETCY